MARVPLYDETGAYLETIEIDPDQIAPSVRIELIRRAVIAYEANRRQGNADTKERGEIAGSHKKPWRQKGTGRARAGHKRSPLWRKGGTVFGPTPRDFRHFLPVKALRNACASALRGKLEDGEVSLIRGLAVNPQKTKTVVSMLMKMGAKGSVLICTEDLDRTVWRCSRNIQGVSALPVDQVNAYHLVRNSRILMTREGFERLRKRVAKPAAAEVAK